MSLNFTIFAQNSKHDYVQQACVAAMSIKLTNPNSAIALITNDEVPDKYQQLFDHIVAIPFNDASINSEWKVENRWKIYHATPFEETVVIDSDVLILSNLDHWKENLNKFITHPYIDKNLNYISFTIILLILIIIRIQNPEFVKSISSISFDSYQKIFKYNEKQDDIIIVDTPPILAVTDPAIVSAHAGSTLLVARFGQNHLREIELTRNRFEQNGIDVKGVVFNGVVRKASNAYGYYGYYNYEYKSDK
mgnify:CR=1 FL=1